LTQISPISELVELIQSSSIKCGETKVVCIDGPAGSGKTTLANSLSKYLDNCPIVHMDEIYEGWEEALSQKTTNDLYQWIIEPLLKKQLIEFFKFDWTISKRNKKVVIRSHSYLIIEGVGSSVKKVSEHASLKIWIVVNQSLGIERVLKRDGQQIKDQMKNWQIQELNYFNENKTRENSNIWIDGSPEVNIDTSSQFVRTNR
jgi:uridine kinase